KRLGKPSRRDLGKNGHFAKKSAPCARKMALSRLTEVPMKRLPTLLLLLIAAPARADEKPLALHPENPHYFLFRGKPVILMTSGEHYGAVLNSEFKTTKYLDQLEKDGLNLTRTFSGVYCEDAKSFNITRNTLAPGEGKLLCPWARSRSPGY